MWILLIIATRNSDLSCELCVDEILAYEMYCTKRFDQLKEYTY